jgi:hypothetical protein
VVAHQRKQRPLARGLQHVPPHRQAHRTHPDLLTSSLDRETRRAILHHTHTHTHTHNTRHTQAHRGWKRQECEFWNANGFYAFNWNS